MIKNKFCLLLLLLLVSKISFSQFVYVPDSALRLWFQYNIPQCVQGNYIDTTNQSLLDLEEMSFYFGNGPKFKNLYGIQYAKNVKGITIYNQQIDSLFTFPPKLEYLKCNGNEIKYLADLPSTLKYLECKNNLIKSVILGDSILTAEVSYNLLDTLSVGSAAQLQNLNCNNNNLQYIELLSSSLLFLSCKNNKLTSLPVLPDKIRVVYADNNLISSVVSLPDSLNVFSIAVNNLASLPALPDSVYSLDCSYNQLSNLPLLPGNLLGLDCSNNQINSLVLPALLQSLICNNNLLSALPTLPLDLKSLNCEFNQITSLPALPSQLNYLYCGHNQLTLLPAIPSTLKYLYCSDNFLDSLPALGGSLESLRCAVNNLTTLPALPSSLRFVYCDTNSIVSIPNIPSGVGIFYCSNNPLISLPALPNQLYELNCANTLISCLPYIGINLHILNTQGTSISCIPNRNNYLDSVLPVCDFSNLFNATNISCGDSCNGSIVLNGANSFSSFLWSNNQTASSIYNLCAGAYSCKITDSLGCYYSVSPASVRNAVHVITNKTTPVNGCNGSISAHLENGVAPYIYTWWETDELNDSLGVIGTDSVLQNWCGMSEFRETHLTVSDSLGCSSDIAFGIWEPATCVFYSGQRDVSCKNANDGQACYWNSVMLHCPYTIVWSNGERDVDCIRNLSPGTYTAVLTFYGEAGSTYQDSAIFNILDAPDIVDQLLLTPATNALCNAIVQPIVTHNANEIIEYYWSPMTYLTETDSVFSNACNNVPYQLTVCKDGCCEDLNFIISDSFPSNAFWLSMISSPEIDCSSNSYDVFLTVHGGSPPFKYQWSSSDPNVSLLTTCDTCQNLMNIDFNGFYPDGITVKCVVEDSAGVIDSMEYFFTPNYPPIIVNGASRDPLCHQYQSGVVWAWSSIMNPSGPRLEIHETNLDSGTYIYIIPYGNGCEKEFEFRLDYIIDDCDSAVTFNVDQPGCGICNGNVTAVDNVGADVSVVFDSNGDTVTAGQFCMDSTYYANFYYTIDINTWYEYTYSVTVTNAGCTPVYPGDANNDGVANNLDLLSIGIAFNDTGSVRADTTITWDAKYAMDWNNSFIDSTNYKHADCNGNGIINDDDTLAIIQNYGQLHNRNYEQHFIQGAPVITVDLPDTISIIALTEAEVSIGDALLPCSDLYGVAFTIQYDPSVINASTVQFIPDSSWFIDNAVDRISIQKNDVVNGYLDIAVTRKDHISKSGYGTFGKLFFKPWHSNQDVITHVELISVTAVNSLGATVLLAEGSDSSVIETVCTLTTTADVTNACDAYCAGKIEVVTSGGVGAISYDWSNSVYDSSLCNHLFSNAPIQDNVSSGSYICIVSDSTGCIDSVATDVYSSILSINENVFYESCSSCDGSIDLAVSGGTLPYIYNWSNGTHNEDLTNECTYYNNFNCTIIDSLGCQFQYDYVANCYPQNAETTHEADCPESDNGKIDFGPIGPQFNFCSYYGYFLNPLCGQQSYVFPDYFLDNACPGNYMFVEISRGGCDTTYYPITLGSLSLPQSTAIIHYPTCGNCDGSIVAWDVNDTIGQGIYIKWYKNGSLISQLPVLTGLCSVDTIDYEIGSGISPCTTFGTAIMDSCLVVSGLTSTNQETEITLQPNPNNGQFYLQGLNKLKGEIKLDIVQPDGKIIHSEIVNAEEKHPLNLNAAQGVYICRITNSEKQIQLKFVVQ